MAGDAAHAVDSDQGAPGLALGLPLLAVLRFGCEFACLDSKYGLDSRCDPL